MRCSRCCRASGSAISNRSATAMAAWISTRCRHAMQRTVFAPLLVAALALAGARASTEGSKVADAAMNRDRATVRTLLTSGEDVNAAQGDGMTALHWAARHGDAELVSMLLAAGANVRATTRLGGYTPLLMAAELGHASSIEALIAAGAD